MAISYPLAFPTWPGPSGVTFGQFGVTGMNVSPFSLVPQIYEWPGAERWELEIGFDSMWRELAEQWISWATSVRGPVGSFLFGDPNGQTPRGTASGSVTATGSARAYTVTLTGGSGTLLRGDWISFGSHRWLHKVQTDITLSGGGVSCDIWPGLRGALSGAAVAITAAKGRFMLTNERPRWSIRPGGKYEGLTLKAIEDLRP